MDILSFIYIFVDFSLFNLSLHIILLQAGSVAHGVQYATSVRLGIVETQNFASVRRSPRMACRRISLFFLPAMHPLF